MQFLVNDKIKCKKLSVNNSCQSKKVYRTRSVVSKNGYNGCSLNWRADWAKLQGKTYAQVVKASSKVHSHDAKWVEKIGLNKAGATKISPPKHSKAPVSTLALENNVNKPQIKSKKVVDLKSPKIAQQKAKLGDKFYCHTKNRFQALDSLVDSPDNGITKATNPVLIQSCKANTHLESQSTTIKPLNRLITGEVSTKCQKARQNHSKDTGEKCQKTRKFCSESYPPHDKYDLALQMKNKNKTKMEQAKGDPTFQLWNKQTESKFGYIPLGPLVLPESDKQVNVGSDPIKLYDITRSQNTFNFLSTQVQVPSQLNPDIWQELLRDYWDQQLPFLIRYGFPLDFDRHSKLGKNTKNHTSAVAFPKDIEAYLAEEIQYGAIHGPFKNPPIHNLHTSPFMTREKPGAPHRRVIIDLSFPHGEAVNSNISKDHYLGTDFILTLPSIDLITDKVRKLGKGSLLYKIDISRAFRHVKIDPRDYFLLGLKHQDYFLDTCLPFGFRHGSGIFQRLSDAIRFIMASRGYDVINYIDDVIGFGTISTAKASFDTLQDLLQKLGFDISIKKLVEPTTKVTCLGVEVNTEEFTISVPHEKLANIMSMCNKWSRKSHCTKKELQSLLGCLLYISKCVKTSRTFLNRMLDTLRAHFGKENISLDIEFHRDLNWFKKFLPKFNGTAFFIHRPVQATIELDACLQGLGAVYLNQVYAIHIPQYCKNFSIVHLEMLNIMVAIRVWANTWKNQRVLIKCDNQAVVSVLNSGRTQDLTLAAIARNIMMDISENDIDLQVIHILGVNNKIADLLSRWFTTKNPGDVLKKILPNPVWLHVPETITNLDWSI